MSWEDVRKDSLPKEELLKFEEKYWGEVGNGMIGPISQGQFENDIIKAFPEDFKFTKETKVFDFACGIGRFYKLIKKYNCEYYGLDISFPYLATFSEILDKGVLVYTKGIDRFPFPNSFFDFTYAGSIFTHLSETQRKFYFDELNRTLKVGGILIITFLDTNNPLSEHQIKTLDRNFVHISMDEIMELSRNMKLIKTGFLLDKIPTKQIVLTFKKLGERIN